MKVNNPYIKEMIGILEADGDLLYEDALFRLRFVFSQLTSSADIKSGLRRDWITKTDMDNCRSAEKHFGKAIGALKNIPMDLLSADGSSDDVSERIGYLTEGIEILRKRLKWILEHKSAAKGAPKKNSDFLIAISVLADTYEEFTGKKASKGSENLNSESFNTEYTGPFFNFCDLALKASGTEFQKAGMQDVIREALQLRSLHPIEAGGKQ